MVGCPVSVPDFTAFVQLLIHYRNTRLPRKAFLFGALLARFWSRMCPVFSAPSVLLSASFKKTLAKKTAKMKSVEIFFVNQASHYGFVDQTKNGLWLETSHNPLIFLAHREGFEPPTYGFVVRCSIQLSHRCGEGESYSLPRVKVQACFLPLPSFPSLSNEISWSAGFMKGSAVMTICTPCRSSISASSRRLALSR